MLCVPTRPWSADASVGQVRLPPLDIASRVDGESRLFQTADTPASTQPESPAATSTLPVGHRPSGRASNRLCCTTYTGVGTSYMDAGAAGILQPAYFRQPTQLRPAAPTQLVSGQFYHPLVFDPGAGMAPVPNWNRQVESWVRAPQGQPTGVPPNASASGWQAGFIPEARGTWLPPGPPGANQSDQSTVPSE